MSDGLPLPRRYWAILAISLGNALVIVDGSIANVALPSIAKALGVDSSASVLVVTIYQLILLMTLLPLANFADQIGHRRLYQYGQLVYVAGSMLCFFAESLPFLLIVRAFQALGAAAMLSISSALLRSIYPSDQLGRGLGVNSVVVSCSAALAPTLGGFILSIAPWPWVFVASMPFALLSLTFGRALPDPQPHDKPFDVLGAVLCATTFGLLFAGTESALHGDSPVVSAAIVVVALFVGYHFVRRERQAPRPILPVDLLAQPTLALSTIAALFGFIATMTMSLWLPFRLQHDFGYSPAAAGAIMAPWPATFMIMSPLSGILSDRIPAGLLGAIGMVIAAISLVLLAFLPADPGSFDIVWRLVLCGIGFGLFFSPNNRLIIGSAPIERASAAGGLVSTTRTVGQTSGATLVAALLTTSWASIGAPLVAAGLALIGSACSAVRLRPALRKPGLDELEEPRP